MSEKWEKVLYKKQKFPDNYVDPSFLSDLSKNVNLYHYSWWEAFIGICFVMHEVCCTVLLVIIFVLMKESDRSLIITPVALIILSISCFVFNQATATHAWIFIKEDFYGYLKSGVIFLTFGYMFSPVLKTLTETISTDTIYAMVVIMLIVHVLFQEYGADVSVVCSTLSLNSALFAAVCLASRLPTVIHTFVLMINAVILFVLLPLMRKQLKHNNFATLIITALFFSLVLVTLIHISTLFTVLFVFLSLNISIIFPSLFVYCQKYKQNIFGPWDEAIVKS